MCNLVWTARRIAAFLPLCPLADSLLAFSPLGFFASWLFHPLTDLPPGFFTPWLVRSMAILDDSPSLINNGLE